MDSYEVKCGEYLTLTLREECLSINLKCNLSVLLSTGKFTYYFWEVRLGSLLTHILEYANMMSVISY